MGGRTLGIVGFGQIGQAVARIGQAFGMRVLANRRERSRRRRPASSTPISIAFSRKATSSPCTARSRPPPPAWSMPGASR
jgi:lactate dehydrogenase-like 2-hydroxyacid dehydrogenase